MIHHHLPHKIWRHTRFFFRSFHTLIRFRYFNKYSENCRVSASGWACMCVCECMHGAIDWFFMIFTCLSRENDDFCCVCFKLKWSIGTFGTASMIELLLLPLFLPMPQFHFFNWATSSATTKQKYKLAIKICHTPKQNVQFNVFFRSLFIITTYTHTKYVSKLLFANKRSQFNHSIEWQHFFVSSEIGHKIVDFLCPEIFVAQSS